MVFKFRRITYSAREAGLEGGKSFLEREEAEHPDIHETSQLHGSVREHVAIRIKLNRRVHPSLLLIQNAWIMRWSVL